MVDEMRVDRTESPMPPGTGPVRPSVADPQRQLPAEAETAHGVPDYDDPEFARAEIEATRARMSETIDEIEGALVRKKERLQNRLDVLSPVRENPWPSMGIALGAGVVVGLLTGGEDDDEDEPTIRPWRDWEHRTGVLEARTRRLLAIARDQEEEIERLQRRAGKKRRSRPLGKRIKDRLEHGYEDVSETVSDTADSARRFGKRMKKRVKHRLEDGYDGLAETADSARSRLDDLRETVVDGLTTFLSDALRQLKGRR